MKYLPPLFAMLILPALGGACGGDKGTTDSGSPGVDTGASNDDTGVIDGEVLTFELTGDWEGASLVLTPFNPDTLKKKASPWLGNPVVSNSPTSETQAVTMPDPEEGHFILADPESWSDFHVAYYLPTLHVDIDGDGLISGAESYEGVGVEWPFYAQEPIPEEVTALGVVPGWNTINLFASEDPDGLPSFGDVGAIPLAGTIGLQETLSIGGTLGSDINTSDMGLAVVPTLLFEEKDTSVSDWEFVYDEALSDSWSIELNGPPPSEHFSSFDDLMSTGAMEAVVAYLDVDGSSTFSDGDWPQALGCLDDQMIALLWIDGITDAWAGLLYSIMGWHSGWSAIRAGEKDLFLVEEADLLNLVIDSSCFPD